MKIRHLLSDALRARMLPGDAGTVPDLVAGLRQAQPFERGAFAELLTEFGSVAVPDVVGLLDDPNSELRWWAANVLRDMGTAAIEAGQNLIEKLVDPEESVRIAAALALAALGVAAEQAVPVLAACVGRILADGQTACYDEECTCADALAALGAYRAAAAPALPEIVRALADASLYVSVTAAETLGSLGPAAVTAGPALAQIVERPVIPFPSGGEHGSTGQTAWRSCQQRLRIAASEALFRVTGMRDQAVDALVTIRDDTQEAAYDRNCAEQALARIAAEGL